MSGGWSRLSRSTIPLGKLPPIIKGIPIPQTQAGVWRNLGAEVPPEQNFSAYTRARFTACLRQAASSDGISG